VLKANEKWLNHVNAKCTIYNLEVLLVNVSKRPLFSVNVYVSTDNVGIAYEKKLKQNKK